MEVFYLLGCCGLLAKSPMYQFSRYFSFQTKFVLITHLTGKRATQNLKKNIRIILVYGHTDIVWTYNEPKKMILNLICRFIGLPQFPRLELMSKSVTYQTSCMPYLGNSGGSRKYSEASESLDIF